MIYLLVYRCTDDDEEESCGLVLKEDGEKFIRENANPPCGFEDRPGYYYLEEYSETWPYEIMGK